MPTALPRTAERADPAATASFAGQPPTSMAGADHAMHARLLNEWQRGFPLSDRPFAQISQALGATENEVIQACAELSRRGVISRIGGVWAPGVGGSALLCAMAVPPERLEQVAAQVSAHPGVNHNYEREHTLNLWFVMTGNDAAQTEQALAAIESGVGWQPLPTRGQGIFDA